MTPKARQIRAAPVYFWPRRASKVPTEQVDINAIAAQVAGIHGHQPAAARFRRWCWMTAPVLSEIDGHLPCIRGAAAGAAACSGKGPPWKSRLVEMWSRRVREQSVRHGGAGFPPPAPGDEGTGSAAGAGLGREPSGPARSSISSRCSTASSPSQRIHRRRPLPDSNT